MEKQRKDGRRGEERRWGKEVMRRTTAPENKTLNNLVEIKR